MTEIAPSAAVAAADEPPSELRTFLFADVRGYTRFTQDRGDEAAAELVTKFARLMRDGVRIRGGRVLEVNGDEAVAVFGSARQALRAAVNLQARFARESDEDPSLPLAVGIGLDAGEAVPVERGYRGEALNLASRLCNLAGPGEILASEGVVYLGRQVQGISYAERGMVPLKGFVEPVRVIRVIGEEVTPVVNPDRPLAAARLPQRVAAMPIGGFLGALPSGVLVGRDVEWEQIVSALDEVSKGSGRLVLLAGEPGIGKTRLAQEVTLKARHWGFLVATGRSYEQEQAVPYYPFLEALVTIYEACPAGLQAEIPRRWPNLSRLLPDQLGMLDVGSSSDGRYLDGEDQQRLLRAVTHLLEAVAELTPVALLLDDIHWADDASLKLLQHLARNTRSSRIFLLGTYRDVEVHRQHPLESALLDLAREGLLEEVEVRRLDSSGTEALMAEIMGEEEDLSDLVGLVHRRTDGNAFFIGEMLRALVERGDVYRKDGRWERRRVEEMEVPKSVRSLIGQRLSRLQEGAQEILREASVLGQEFAFDDLQMLVSEAPPTHISEAGDAGKTEDAIDAALEQAIVLGLVRETGPEHYAFNHALTQQALYAELTTRRRKRLHLAAGTVLQRLSEKSRKRRAGELEWHFLEGDDAEHALPYALLAGDQAEEVFANGDAERHYRTALDLARELGDQTREVEAREKLAGVLSIAARYTSALELLEGAVAIHQASDNREGEACVVAQMANVYYARETRDEGIARLRPLVDVLENDRNFPRPSYGLAALWAALARLYTESHRAVEQLRAAERAIEIAQELHADRLLVGAEVSRGEALWELGQEDEALRVLEDVISRAEAAGDLNALARALGNTGVYYARRGDLEKDRVYHERALEISERRGDRGQIVFGAMILSMNAFLTGDWDGARLYLQRAEKVIRSLGVTPLATWPTSARGWMALREGDLAAAREYAEEAERLAEGGDADWQRLVQRLLAEIDLLSEQPRAALTRLESAQSCPGWRADAGFLGTLAWAYLENLEPEKATEAAVASVEQARRHKSRADLPSALVIAGTVMSGQQRWEEARQYLDEALLLTRGMQLRFEEGRALLAYGIMLRQRGEIEEGIALVRQALTLFERLGAQRDAERAQQELAALQRR